MKVGLAPCQEHGGFRTTLAQTLLAEELGYDSVWLFEHHDVEYAGGETNYIPSPLVLLAALATRTSRLLLGTGVVILPLTHPVRLAEEAAMVDEISQGRLILGVGTGYRQAEFAAFGVPYQERGARTEEALRLLVRLLSERQVTQPGRFYPVNAVSTPPPIQQPRLPILVAGWSRPALRRAARFGDGWIGGVTADYAKVRECIAIYREELVAAGKDPAQAQIALERECFVAATPEDRAAAAEALYRMYLAEHVSWEHSNVQGTEPTHFAAIARDRFLLGSPTEVLAELERYAALGVGHFILRMHYRAFDPQIAERSMRLFAREVLPALRQLPVGAPA
ncbi:MAG: luciferase [Dehalococcoidia bacterium]|nr:MAG: luciferase [Dehalococcoidia bacterium]